MFHAPMVNLAKSAEQLKKDMPGIATISEKREIGPIYPYGCCLSLDEDVMKKLGLDGEMPSPGDLIHLCITAQVRAVPGERLDDDGKAVSSGCVELQCIEMGCPPSDPTQIAAHVADEAIAKRRKRFYPNTESDGDEA